MSLKVGGLDVVGVFVGDAAAKVYVGAMKIWPPVPDFTPFTISSEDPGYADLIDEQVPEGATGCWVTLIGGGGSGGTGRRIGGGNNRSGGGGGGRPFTSSTSAWRSGKGGDGYVLIEWE
ncbi:hypothetical protein SEA_AJAY_36 [Mycobacterium phage Ajay]|nr:hypothetical protein SEA_AJAY_36 [Mycobacterium phage Ajay]